MKRRLSFSEGRQSIIFKVLKAGDGSGFRRALKRASSHLRFRFPCSLRDRVSNESAAPTPCFEFAVILNLFQSSGFHEWVLLVLTASVMQTSGLDNSSSIENAPFSNTTRTSSFQT